MSEAEEYSPDLDVNDATGEASETPEATEPAIDFAGHGAAFRKHQAAVSEAHDTLAQRVENAYSIFCADLDRAYRVWEDDTKLLRTIAAGVASTEGADNGEHGDPTRAR